LTRDAESSSVGIRWFWWLATFACMAAIWWSSARLGSSVQIASPWDKLAHLGAYMVLGALSGAATGSARRGFLTAAFYGALDEAHQVFSPGRASGFDDWFADILGGLIGGLIGARGQVN
jgi:VanZ family protein